MSTNITDSESLVNPSKEKRSKLKDHYMTLQQLNDFRDQLLEQKKQLLNEVDRTMSHFQSEERNYADVNDRASYEEGFALELKTRDRDRKLIKKIDDTIGRIHDYEYGYCEACGHEIGIKRLKVRPTAVLCIDCKTFDEIRER